MSIARGILFHYIPRQFKEEYVMAGGKVKWFNEVKGYGFITMDDGKEVFVHYTGIKGEGFRTLNEGDSVEFEITEGPKGLQAVNVQRVS